MLSQCSEFVSCSGFVFLWLFFYCYRISVGCRVGVFFFFKQKTAYEMRISDWSSDVCSSDVELVGMACWAGGQPGQSAALAARLPCHLVHDRLPVARILVYEFLEALPFEFEFMDIEVHDELNRALVDFANPEIGWYGRRNSGPAGLLFDPE